MKKNKIKKFIYLVLLFFFVLSFQTIVYSAINATLTVKGDAYARSEADVRITGFRLATTNNATSSFEEYGKNHIITEVELKDSSSMTYYVEITNYGSEDVGIFDITGLPSGVNYTIKDYNLKDKICDDSGKCNSFIKKNYELTLTTTSTYTGSIQMNFDFRIFHKVTYTGIENKGYPTDVIDGGNLIISFKEDLERVQVLSNNNELGYYKTISNGSSINVSNIPGDVEVKIKPRVAKLMSGSLNEAGSEVCIGNECFNVVSNDGSTVTMLAKYNLFVGNYCTAADQCIPYGDEATGLQDPTKIARPEDGSYPRYGTVQFSSSEYWCSTREECVNFYQKSVYDSNSTLYSYVENYKSYLEMQGVNINNARIMKTSDFTTLGCIQMEKNGPFGCLKEGLEWPFTTTYWVDTVATNSVNDISGLLFFIYVGNQCGAGACYQTNPGTLKNLAGVRPVIEIDIDEIALVRTISGDYDTVGSEVCISSECFYVMASTDDTITMLAKYNLYVAGKYFYGESKSEYVAYGDEATGIQHPDMVGIVVETQGTVDTSNNGVVPFSYSAYWDSNGLKSQYGTSYPAYVYDSNSEIYPYVENYKTYLGSVGVLPMEARLIKYQELLGFGCPDAFTYENPGTAYCNQGNAPSWLYSTSYWTGVAYADQYVYRISNSSAINFHVYHEQKYFGVRPVITIEKPKF